MNFVNNQIDMRATSESTKRLLVERLGLTDLSVRIRNVFRANDLKYVGDLARCSVDDLLRITVPDLTG